METPALRSEKEELFYRRRSFYAKSTTKILMTFRKKDEIRNQKSGVFLAYSDNTPLELF